MPQRCSFREPVALSRSHVAASLGAEADLSLLAGRPGADCPDLWPQVCACINVGAETIARAIVDHGLTSVEDFGKTLRAGTSCVSSRPELRALLLRHAPQREAAE